MSERRILVIGSQCEALGHLSFLPQAAKELYAVMTDSGRGGCVPAIESEGLLIDPTVNEAKNAIGKAYERASKDEAALFIAYVGHGEHADDDFYLLPRDAQNPPTSDTAVHLTNLIKEAHRKAPGRVDGLAVLVDACYSGLGGFSAAQAWISGLKGTLRFEVITAAADRPAANGCFTLTLAKLLRNGVSAVPDEHLRCVHLRRRIEESCPNQVPQHPAYNPDETLWLAKNAGRVREPWAQTPLADEIQRLTLAYQVTPALVDVVTRSKAERCLAVVGEAGTGKSALAAALAWPDVAQGAVPSGFVQAVAFLTEATTPQELARTLGEQLGRSVPRFGEAQLAFAKETPYVEQQRLGTLERQLVGPLQGLAPEREVRFVIDALDRLGTSARGAVMDALNGLARLQFVRLVVTARPETPLPDAASHEVLAAAPAEKVTQYLEQRAVAQARREEVIKSAEGNWLVVRVLADILSEHPEAEIHAGRLALADAYEELLSRCGANDSEDAGLVLSVMAAAGAGPVLPLTLLCAAGDNMGGPATPARMRDELFRLRGLVMRSGAGTEREHAGLFHQTLVEHILARAPDEALVAHRALVDCIQSLAPAGTPMDIDDPVERYAFEREAEHLWALGETDEALTSLGSRIAAAPRDNLRRWSLWGSRVENELGPDHPNTLTNRNDIASWTGECGDARAALRLFEALLPYQVRVLGPDHSDTLTTRNNIAHWTGECGDEREALELFEALLPDQVRVLGADHPDTLTTRSNIASWTGECGDAREALRLFEALLPDQVRVLGPDDPDTLTTRNNIAHWTGECGDEREALELFEALLPDQVRVLGADHPDTLTTRSNIASSTGECGDEREALELFEALLPDQVRVLGADHSDTLLTRNNIAAWTVECGDARAALRLFEALLADQVRVLGPDHPDTLTTRGWIHSLSAG